MAKDTYSDIPFGDFLIDIGRQDSQTVYNSLEKVTLEILEKNAPDAQITKVMRERGYGSFVDVPFEYVNNEKHLAEVFDPNLNVLADAGMKNPASKLEQIRNVTNQASVDRGLKSGFAIFSKMHKTWFQKPDASGLDTRYLEGTGLGLRRAFIRIHNELGNNATLQKLRPNASPELIAREAVLEMAIKDIQGPRDTDFAFMTPEGLDYKHRVAEFVTKTAGKKEQTIRILYNETQALIKGHLGDGEKSVKSKVKGFVFWNDIKDEKIRKRYATEVQKAYNAILKAEVPKVKTKKGMEFFTSSYQRKRAIDRLENIGTSEKSVSTSPLGMEKDAALGRKPVQGSEAAAMNVTTYKGRIRRASPTIRHAGTEVVHGSLLTMGFNEGLPQFAKFFGLDLTGKIPNVIYHPETLLETSSLLAEHQFVIDNGIPITDENGKLKFIPYNDYIKQNEPNFVRAVEGITPDTVNIVNQEPSPELKKAKLETATASTLFDMKVEAETTKKFNQIDDMLSSIYPEFDSEDRKGIIQQSKATTAPDTLKSWFIESADIDDALEVLENTEDSPEYWKDLHTEGVIDDKQLAFAEKNQFLPTLKDADVPGNAVLFGTGQATAIDKASGTGQRVSSRTQTNLAAQIQNKYGTTTTVPVDEVTEAPLTWKDYLPDSVYDYNPDETADDVIKKIEAKTVGEVASEEWEKMGIPKEEWEELSPREQSSLRTRFSVDPDSFVGELKRKGLGALIVSALSFTPAGKTLKAAQIASGGMKKFLGKELVQETAGEAAFQSFFEPSGGRPVPEDLSQKELLENMQRLREDPTATPTPAVTGGEMGGEPISDPTTGELISPYLRGLEGQATERYMEDVQDTSSFVDREAVMGSIYGDQPSAGTGASVVEPPLTAKHIQRARQKGFVPTPEEFERAKTPFMKEYEEYYKNMSAFD